MIGPHEERVVVLDTDVFSFIFGSKPEADPYLNDVRGHIAAVTFVTVAELYRGACKRNW